MSAHAQLISVYNVNTHLCASAAIDPSHSCERSDDGLNPEPVEWLRHTIDQSRMRVFNTMHMILNASQGLRRRSTLAYFGRSRIEMLWVPMSLS
jgi:hypothetical protein